MSLKSIMQHPEYISWDKYYSKYKAQELPESEYRKVLDFDIDRLPAISALSGIVSLVGLIPLFGGMANDDSKSTKLGLAWITIGSAITFSPGLYRKRKKFELPENIAYNKNLYNSAQGSYKTKENTWSDWVDKGNKSISDKNKEIKMKNGALKPKVHYE